jgi:heme oxygenase
VPASRAEALGALYVLEGSTLGGRMILRALADRGVATAELAFLDPYGLETAGRWRDLMEILGREIRGESDLAAASRGAVRTFAHAHHILCGTA